MYGVVQEHLETFLDQSREPDGDKRPTPPRGWSTASSPKPATGNGCSPSPIPCASAWRPTDTFSAPCCGCSCRCCSPGNDGGGGPSAWRTATRGPCRSSNASAQPWSGWCTWDMRDLLHGRPGGASAPRSIAAVGAPTAVRGIRSRCRRALVHPQRLRYPRGPRRESPVHVATVAAAATARGPCCGLQIHHATSPHERTETTPAPPDAGESRAARGQWRWPRRHAARAGANDRQPFRRGAARGVPARKEPASHSAADVQELLGHALVHTVPLGARSRPRKHRVACPAGHPLPVQTPRAPEVAGCPASPPAGTRPVERPVTRRWLL